MTAEKAVWRERFQAARRERSATCLAEASTRIVARLAALPEVQAAGTVHLFWPLPGEVDLRALADRLSAGGTTVALPLVQGKQLAHRRYQGTDRLVEGPWGLREPALTAPTIAPAEIDVVIVPALALGRDGSRIGYGGGYYDGFLAQTPALRIGVVTADALVGAVPTEPHDARIQLMVTEDEVWRVEV